ncbi:hypothetical protein N802_15240 [Knoellia sinensis KCTC 19936]|uniref:Uncharacterized protein n=1 Tax=Knoellia sinensis KCTC 19936 TaxID=1385520 RepID=A0A0A0JBM2_9MICO|nr:hypothetical protein [Knoellia sinensis]KGN33412.1 hypothetical protein N802_15240 [Knoellia sinensis KCTC 19936]
MNTTDHDSRDPLDLLTTARPTDASLDTTWSSTRSEGALATMQRLAESDGKQAYVSRLSPRRRTTRRWAALGGVAAAMAFVAIVAPALLGRGSTSATAAITPLISIAENADPVVIPAGHFLHLVTVENPDGLPPGSAGDAPLTRESWMSSDGHLWRRTSPPSGRVVLEDLGAQDGNALHLPQSVSTLELPTDANALEAFLRRRVQGSSSQNEAVFEAIAALSRAGDLPPRVRAASLEVLASLPEVTAAKVSVAGQRVVRVEFADDSIRKDETKVMLFASTTANLLEEAQTSRGETNYRSVITRREVVAAMPPGLADQARRQEAARTKWMTRCNGPDAIPNSPDCVKKPIGIN